MKLLNRYNWASNQKPSLTQTTGLWRITVGHKTLVSRRNLATRNLTTAFAVWSVLCVAAGPLAPQLRADDAPVAQAVPGAMNNPAMGMPSGMGYPAGMGFPGAAGMGYPAGMGMPGGMGSPAEMGQMMLQGVQMGSFELVQMALMNGADVNTRDPEGKTALMLAAGLGRTDMVKALLEKGADANAVDKAGRSALHLVLSTHPGSGTFGAPPKKKKGGVGKALGKVASVGLGLGASMLGGGMLGAPMLGGMLAQGLGSTLMKSSMPGMGMPNMGMMRGNLSMLGQTGWNAVLNSALPQSASNKTIETLLNNNFKEMDAAAWTNLLQTACKNNPQLQSSLAYLIPGADETQSREWGTFLTSAAKGDKNTVQKYLSDPKFQPLLHAATQELQEAAANLPGRDGGIGIVKALLEKGANKALADKDGLTPEKAAEKRGLSVMATFLKTGVLPVSAPAVTAATAPATALPATALPATAPGAKF